MRDSVDEPMADIPERESVLSEWMSPGDLAEELSVSQDTLKRWRAARTGPPFAKIGVRVYYRRDAVKDWLRDQEGRGQV